LVSTQVKQHNRNEEKEAVENERSERGGQWE